MPSDRTLTIIKPDAMARGLAGKIIAHLEQAGFRIAAQNCFRCHNAGEQGATKAGLSWGALGALAAASAHSFAAYIRDPRAKNPHAQMPGNPHYDEATVRALTAYFLRAFAPPAKP